MFVLLLIGAGIGPLSELPLYVLYHQAPLPVATQGRVSFTFVQTLGSVFGLLMGGVFLQDQLVKRIADAVGGTQSPITLLADLNSLSTQMQDILRPILTDSLRSVWCIFTIMAGMRLLASFVIRYKKSR